MRRFTRMSAALCLAVVASCDEQAPRVPQPPLEGTWRLLSFESTSGPETVPAAQELIFLFDPSAGTISAHGLCNMCPAELGRLSVDAHGEINILLACSEANCDLLPRLMDFMTGTGTYQIRGADLILRIVGSRDSTNFAFVKSQPPSNSN